jgi:multidrug efflux system membrane fusion protein
MKDIHQLKALAGPLAVALALAGFSAIGLVGCDAAKGKPAAAAAAGGPPVSVAAVIEKQIAETQEFSGRLEAIERVDIRSRVGGFITSVNFKPGGEVRKGAVLFVIDPRPFQAEASRTEAAAAAARARADLARLELVRAEKLLLEKAIAQRELDDKAASVKELDANARAAQASHEAARLNLSYTRVQSPIDGRVSKAEITVGNLVDSNAILTSVVSLERIYASFDGDEASYLRVGALARKGAPVTVKVGLANETGFPHEGRLDFVDNRLDPQTGSVRMRATFANADHALAPGLFARVQLGGGSGHEMKRAILISERAIGTDQNRKFVFVAGADGKAEYRPVKLGPLFDGLRVVREGLKGGEKIVVNGLQRVRPGAPLTAQTVTMDVDAATPAATPTAASASAPDARPQEKSAAKVAVAKDAS